MTTVHDIKYYSLLFVLGMLELLGFSDMFGIEREQCWQTLHEKRLADGLAQDFVT